MAVRADVATAVGVKCQAELRATARVFELEGIGIETPVLEIEDHRR